MKNYISNNLVIRKENDIYTGRKVAIFTDTHAMYEPTIAILVDIRFRGISDIYSLGILMYELLTGKLPFRGETAVEIALKQLKEPMPSIRKEIPDIPQSIENIILRATAKNPKNRYADAREMHDDLLTCLDESRKNEFNFSCYSTRE